MVSVLDLNNDEVQGTGMCVVIEIGVEAGSKSRKGRDANFSKASSVDVGSGSEFCEGLWKERWERKRHHSSTAGHKFKGKTF